MATVSIFSGDEISINGMNGFTVKNAIITEVETSSFSPYSDTVYHCKAEATSVAIGTDRVPPLFPRIDPSMGECVIEIGGKKIHGRMESCEISFSHNYNHSSLNSIISRMPQMERRVTFSFIINSIDLEYEVTFPNPEKKKEEDRPIDNRWEILDL